MRERGTSVRRGIGFAVLVSFAAFGLSCSFEVSSQAKNEESAAEDTATPASSAGPKRHIQRTGRNAREKGHLRFAYGETENPTYQELQTVFAEERFFEDVVEELDQSFVLPNDIQISLAECGEVDAHFDPNDDSIHLCYEMLEYFLDIFGQQAGAETEAELGRGVGLCLLPRARPRAGRRL
jgi:hypothetical protein